MGLTRRQKLGRSRSRSVSRQTCCRWATWRSIRDGEDPLSSGRSSAKALRLRAGQLLAASREGAGVQTKMIKMAGSRNLGETTTMTPMLTVEGVRK